MRPSTVSDGASTEYVVAVAVGALTVCATAACGGESNPPAGGGVLFASGKAICVGSFMLFHRALLARVEESSISEQVETDGRTEVIHAIRALIVQLEI